VDVLIRLGIKKRIAENVERTLRESFPSLPTPSGKKKLGIKLRPGGAGGSGGVSVTFPNGDVVNLPSPGDFSVLCQGIGNQCRCTIRWPSGSGGDWSTLTVPCN
jgi:hypothetical protein